MPIWSVLSIYSGQGLRKTLGFVHWRQAKPIAMAITTSRLAKLRSLMQERNVDVYGEKQTVKASAFASTIR